MDTKKALIIFLINTLLLGGFPDFRMNMQEDYLSHRFAPVQTIPADFPNPTPLKHPAQLPSPYELIASPTPKPTAAPTATPSPVPTVTPAPTSTPKPTPVPTQVPLGKKKVQSKKPGNLTFTYPEAAPLNTDTATYTLLVNKEYPISSKYIPYMVEPDVEIYHKGINERRYLQPIAATALEELFAAAEEDGFHLVLRCGFRSYNLQKAIYSWNLKTYGYYEVTRYHALEGTSEHQTGLAVDLCCEATDYKNNYDILKTPEYAWLLENAHHYGWILRYPEDKTEITGYNFEPWHFRYVGVELATYLKEQDIVLEEYYGALPTTNLIAVPEKYWSYLSDEDYAFMMEEIAAYEKKQEEAAKLPSPTPEAEPTDAPEPTDIPENPAPSPTATAAPEEGPDVSPTAAAAPEEDSDVSPTATAAPEEGAEHIPTPLPEDAKPEHPAFVPEEDTTDNNV